MRQSDICPQMRYAQRMKNLRAVLAALSLITFGGTAIAAVNHVTLGKMLQIKQKADNGSEEYLFEVMTTKAQRQTLGLSPALHIQFKVSQLINGKPVLVGMPEFIVLEGVPATISEKSDDGKEFELSVTALDRQSQL